ncbi:MAG: transposase, partial [Verrucomicrobiota bacterium]
QMSRFLRKLPVSKPKKRFAHEMLHGIVSRQSVKLSEIGRSLNESVALIKTEDRLCHHLYDEKLGGVLEDYILEEQAQRVRERTLLILDPSDLMKKYAEKMQYLANVRDGSEKKIVRGYWLCSVVGAECEGEEMTPLAQRLWSQNAPDHQSENAEILDIIQIVSDATQKRGIWVIDRGGDRMNLFAPLLEKGLDFIVRLRGDRHLIWRGRPYDALRLAQNTPILHSETITREKPNGEQQKFTLHYGFRKVFLPGIAKQLYLFVIQGFGRDPLMILTTVPLTRSYTSLHWMLQAYLTRWKIEETIRFIKQTYQLEDIRLLTYRRLQNMMAFVLLALTFTMTHLGSQIKLRILCYHALRAGKRLFGIPDFKYYAIADGLRELFHTLTTPLFNSDPIPITPDLPWFSDP